MPLDLTHEQRRLLVERLASIALDPRCTPAEAIDAMRTILACDWYVLACEVVDRFRATPEAAELLRCLRRLAQHSS